MLSFLNSALGPIKLVASQQPPPIYGYGVGDHYRFSDNLTETLDAPDENLLWQTRHDIDVRILSIVEHIGEYTIRITARVTNFTSGYTDYASEQFFEGYTPIVTSFWNYFTHTEWEMHLIDWNLDVEAFQTLTGYVGFREQDLDSRYFHWNFTQYVNDSLSIIDIDDDGSFDGYQSYSCYTAQFNAAGVVLLRRYYLAFRFDCNYRYSRLRLVEQILPETSSQETIPSFIPVLIASVTGACVLLGFVVMASRKRRT